MERLEQEDKHWKFSMADLNERSFWNEYQAAFEDMLRNTSTRWAPWWVIPADHKWVTRTLVAGITTEAIRNLRLRRPTVTTEQRRLLTRAKRQLGSGKVTTAHGH